jgi:exodeoxyribonuclease V alpha subunit
MHQRIQQRFGIDTREIMVLSPQRAGCVGINALNVALRGILNPPSDDPTEPFVTMPFAERGAAKGAERPTLRRGDRVLVTQNDYRLGVVNGDLGTVQEIIPGGGRRDESGKLIEDQILVAIDGSGDVVTFAGQSITSLRHAYCMSVHKSQGSEARAVIVVASSSHYIMLGRRLLYTAVTRAKELLVLVGDHPGLAMALRDKTEETRRTRLAGMLAARATTTARGQGETQ